MSRRPVASNEREVIRRLVKAERDSARYLEQLDRAKVEVVDEYGSLQIFPADALAPKGPLQKLSAEGAINDLDGVRIEVLLFVRDGNLSELQIYKVDGSQIRRVAINAEDMIVTV